MANETAEERMARWWADWWARDYSWAGLAKVSAGRPGRHDKPWDGWWVAADGRVTTAEHGSIRSANRQDYWRRGPGSGRDGDLRDDALIDAELELAGELVRDFYGRLWHSAYVPDVWPDGTPAKSAWDDEQTAGLNRLLTARLDLALAGVKGGADLRAQFRGAILLGAPRPSQRTTSLAADFDRVCFLGRADFSDFPEREVPTFAGYASFLNAAFSGEATFENAVFSDYAWFENAVFSRYARFESAAFSNNASFLNASFFGNASFENAAFSGYAWFENAAFSGYAWFGNAVFLGQASFAGQVQDLRAAATIQGLRLEAPDVDGVRAVALATDGGQTGKARRSFAAFNAESALFAEDVDFNNRDFLASTSFKGARFLGLAKFHGDILHPDTSFQDATFDTAMTRDAKFVGVPESDWRDWRNRFTKDDPTLDIDTWRGEREAAWREARAERYANHDRRYEDLERAFRTLKQAMEGHRHRVEEARFFRLELQARSKRRDIPAWERIASDFYGLTSDYGSDILRPQAWLLALALLVAVVVWVPARHACVAFAASAPPKAADTSPVAVAARVCPATGVALWDRLGLGVDALAFSFGNTLPLPEAFKAADDPRDHAVATILKANAPPFWRLALRALSTTQSILSVILIFLTGLALRRRFQIN